MTNRLLHNRSTVVIPPLICRLLIGCLLTLCAAGWGSARAQAPGVADGAAEEPQAMILVAAPQLADPNFAGSVVLVTRTPVGEMIGVILNRPTSAPWPGDLRPSATQGTRRMHFGGPLVPRATLSVGAAPSVVADTLNLGAGLRFAVGQKNTRSLAAAGAPEGALKLFNGYAGWGPGQLEGEIAAGFWLPRAVTPELVFDPEPETQWERLTALRRAVRAPAAEAALAAAR